MLGLLVTLLPTLFQTVFTTGVNLTLPNFPSNPVGILTNLFTFGLYKLAIDQVDGKEKQIRTMFFSFQKAFIRNALILSLLFWLISELFAVFPTLIQQYGKELIGQSATMSTSETGIRTLLITNEEGYMQGELLFGGGALLSLAFTFLNMVLFFPIQYRFVLHPEESVLKQLINGIALGKKNWAGILFYRFTVGLPLGLLFLVYYSCTLFLVQLAVFVIVAFLAALYVYAPYMILADAALAKHLFELESKGERMPFTRAKRKGARHVSASEPVHRDPGS